MIKIDIVIAISLLLFFSISIILILWLLVREKKDKAFYEINETCQCPYCTFVFNSLKNSKIITCPRCKSYLSGEEQVKEP